MCTEYCDRLLEEVINKRKEKRKGNKQTGRKRNRWKEIKEGKEKKETGKERLKGSKDKKERKRKLERKI
jgi:hypothetical protein